MECHLPYGITQCYLPPNRWNKKFELMLTTRTKAYSMSVLICNCFHERLGNIGNIATFTGVLLFDALVRGFPWTWKIETWTIDIYVQCQKFRTQFLHVYLNWFRCNSLLKCVLQPEVEEKSIKKLLFLAFKFIQDY